MTIKEVARLAGVSPAAVSRYLNGGPVSDEKRERIRTVIEETGYHPDPMAQTMRTGRSTQIGVIIPKINSDSASEIVAGIAEKLSQKNFIMMLGVTGGKAANEIQYIASMQNNQVAGIILMGTVMSEELRETIDNSGKPVVVTGQNFDEMNCVFHDDFGAVRELMSRMLEKGRTKIAYLGAMEKDASAGRARQEGAEAAWQERMGRDVPLRRVVADGFGPENGHEAMIRLLRGWPDVDGVICATDRLAAGAMAAIREAGRRIPEEIAIAGVGDSWADPVMAPPLSSAHLYYRECGREAADLLIRLIDTDEDLEPQHRELAYTIVDRGSM